MGVTECIKNELLHPYPVMTEKKGDVVAQFKYTVAVRKEGPFILSGLTIDPSKFKSEYTIDNDEINEKLKVNNLKLYSL